MSTKTRNYNIAVLESALQVLDHFLANDSAESTMSAISEQLGLTKNRTFRILCTLTNHDYLRQDSETRRYRLGPKLIQLGERARKGFKLVEVAAPIMTRLAEQTGETVFLGVVDGWEMLCIDRRESLHSIRLNAQIGQRVALHTGGVPKTLLAFQPPSFIEEYLSRPLTRATGLTITDPARLRDALAEVRERGVCITCGDLEPGACSIAAPIRDHSKQVVSAISAAGPETRFGSENIPRIVQAVCQAAAEISRLLGYPEKK
ncbi:MAG: IclR family transcriptional regulator [Chloroflexota bacterium]